MPETLLVEPDSAFINAVMASGGLDLKKCFQCATCTSLCSLSTEDRPFPRQLMIEAQWGMKEELMEDPAVWLCHNCGDCTANCPRGAHPAELMGALRSQAIQHYARPQWLGRIVADPKYLPLLFLFPALIFAAIARWAPSYPLTAPYTYAQVFPEQVLEALFFAVAGFAVISFALSVRQMAMHLRRGGLDGHVLPGLMPALAEIISHRRFGKCTTEHNRYWGHLLTFSSFIGLAAMSTTLAFGTWFSLAHSPLSQTNPLKLFANLCALIIVVGLSIIFANRLRGEAKPETGSYFDWIFLLNLAGVAVTGILSEILRLEQIVWAMYPIYFLHLTLTFNLFVTTPYSKFGHLVYRTVAMAATWKGREARPTPPETRLDALTQ